MSLRLASRLVTQSLLLLFLYHHFGDNLALLFMSVKWLHVSWYLWLSWPFSQLATKHTTSPPNPSLHSSFTLIVHLHENSPSQSLWRGGWLIGLLRFPTGLIRGETLIPLKAFVCVCVCMRQTTNIPHSIGCSFAADVSLLLSVLTHVLYDGCCLCCLTFLITYITCVSGGIHAGAN